MRILLVDDVPAVRMYFRLVLSGLTSTMDEAGDGVEALRLLAQTRYDLVVLDINLPLLDGLKVLAKLRSDSPSQATPVIVVSTVSDPDALARIKALGAHVLSKPVQAFRLLDTARSVLDLPYSSTTYERRASRRLRLAVAIQFSGDDHAVKATTLDLSATGAFIITEQVKPLGTIGNAIFTVPHLSAPIEVQCMVVHVRATPVGTMPVGMGVRFVNVSLEAQKQLFEILISPQ